MNRNLLASAGKILATRDRKRLGTVCTAVGTRMMSSFPVAASIQEKLTATFQPTHVDVINESHMHNV